MEMRVLWMAGMVVWRALMLNSRYRTAWFWARGVVEGDLL